MVSRREMLLALAAAGAAVFQRRSVVASSTGIQTGPTPVKFRVPARACDCHVHVFGDATRFPFSPDRPYTPPPAPVAELRKFLRSLRLERVVIVTPESLTAGSTGRAQTVIDNEPG